ncbi:hypothetical protein CN345_29525 [Bacillus thuringiensis]|uniref:DUF6622 family protein n=1 Tax=Bacillus thuringiensis TaxID=1428 RepID=UPI000BF2A034|nr:DUF6622 family protein [Bacillus thuringiensis]PEZ20590.1 hypothetical protein CN345_29525 [Bacillus thuringiensis]PGY50690.1 hypothetical protein COE09_18495 [Bacillus thuringiensis]
MIFKIVQHTPMWVWILFTFLFSRGISASQEREVNIPRSLIVPTIFIFWGVYNIFVNFSFQFYAFLSYMVCLGVGTFLGYKLYSKRHRFFLKNGALFRTKNYLPLIIILINFIVKYTLNTYMYINPDASHNLNFIFLYTMTSGSTAGLFCGGIVNTYQQKNKLLG